MSTAQSQACPLGCPIWAELPDADAEALAAAGFDCEWYDTANSKLRLAILNVYQKLRALGFWRFVARNAGSSGGCLNFETDDWDGLLTAIAEHAQMTPPSWKTPKSWQARERRVFGSLHFKHFEGWPEGKLQAHIDRTGAVFPWWCWALPVIGLALIALHALHYHSYKDVEGIRAQLLKQGVGDPRVLGAPRGQVQTVMLPREAELEPPEEETS